MKVGGGGGAGYLQISLGGPLCCVACRRISSNQERYGSIVCYMSTMTNPTVVTSI